MLTQDEFLCLAIQEKDDIKKMCRDITFQSGHAGAFKHIMRIRRDLQEALAKFSKKKSKLDGVQLNAMRITRWLEIWCGQWFRLEAKKEILKKHLNIAPVRLQRMAEHEWETYIRKQNY